MANANELLVPISNPLLVDLVADKLFEFLSFNDILTQRRVCKLWQSSGLTSLKKGINAITISFDREKSIEKFLKMAKGSTFDFTNFSIHYWNYDAESRLPNANQTNRFLEEYGTHIKVISLNLCGSTNCWTFLSDILVNKAPNLEGLRMERYPQRSKATGLFSGKKKPELKLKHLMLCWNGEVTEPMECRTLLADLFASSPRLEKLIVIFASHDWIVIVLQTLADSGTISNLKEISLNVGNNEILEILATSYKSAPLEKILIQIYQADLPMLGCIGTWFSDHKDTLTCLNFFFPCVEFHNKLPFPIMNNLKILSIHDWCICYNGQDKHQFPFGAFDFGKRFPNLRTLRLYEDPMFEGYRFFNLGEMFPEDTTPVSTLKNLELPPISNPDMLRRIKRIFPKVLKMVVVPQTPDVLIELWTAWPEIKTLHISILPFASYSSINLDSVFTGVAGSDHSRNFPSISHLGELKHLRISGGSYPSGRANEKDIRIKNETACLALAKMKGLVSLQISRDRHEISSLCVRHLSTELGMLEVETETGDRSLHLVKYEWQKRSIFPTLPEYE